MCPQSEVYKKNALNYYCWHAPNSDVVDGRSVTLPQTAASYWGLHHACLLLCGTHNVLCVPFFLAIPWPQDSPLPPTCPDLPRHSLSTGDSREAPVDKRAHQDKNRSYSRIACLQDTKAWIPKTRYLAQLPTAHIPRLLVVRIPKPVYSSLSI